MISRGLCAVFCVAQLSLPAVSFGQSIQHHVVSTNEWLYPDTQIPSPPVHSIDLHAPRGGRTGFQVLLRGLNTGSPLTCRYDGPLQPEIFQLIDVKVPENSGPPCSAVPPDQPTPEYVIRKAPYRVYEALRPLREGDRVRGETDALYVSFMIAGNSRPGQKPGTLHVTIGNETVKVTVNLNIHKARVPEPGHLHVRNGFGPDRVAFHHKIEPWSAEHWEMLRRYARMMRRGRQTHFVPIRPIITTRTDGNGWKFDFSRTEKMIRMFLEEGLTHIELPHVAQHDRRKEAVAKFLVHTGNKAVPGTSHEAYVFLAQYLPAWADMLRQNGWYDRVVQNVVDEPPPSEFGNNRILAGLVRKFLPGIPLIAALNDPGLIGAVDIWVPVSKAYEEKREGFEAHRSRGDTLWFYTCCNPTGFYLNRLIDNELLRTRLLHWGNWRYRLDGYLHWGLNKVIDIQDPFENTCPPHGPYHNFHLPPGDSHIIYPGDDGPWSSVRFEAMASGIEDYELLRAVAVRNERLADEICLQLVRSFTDYDATVEKFDTVHLQLLEAAGN
jgi:hypothetical protein